MAQPAFLARDFTANPVEANPASAPVVPVFGGSSPASYVSTYVPSYATKWVEALQGQLSSLMSDIQAVFGEVDNRLQPLENNDAGYQNAAQVSQAVNDGLVGYATEAFVSGELNNYDTSAQVDSKVATATTDMATNASVAGDITTALASYDNSTAVDSKISTAISNLVDGAPSNLDTLNEIAAAYAAADSTLQGLINTNSGDLSNAQSRIADLEQLVADLSQTVYGP